jgi:hypothetical protein
VNICLTEKEKAELERVLNSSSYFDQEETYKGCTVQVLTNTKTGEVSVGWIRPDGSVARIV